MVLDPLDGLLGGGRGRGTRLALSGDSRVPAGTDRRPSSLRAHTPAGAGRAPLNLQGEWACVRGWGVEQGRRVAALGSSGGDTSARPLEGPFGEKGGALKLSDPHRRQEEGKGTVEG